jgi:ankyrin repeat protein
MSQQTTNEALDKGLIEAAGRGDKAAVGSLTAQGAKGFAREKGGLTALMLAAIMGHAECVELLLPVSDPLATDWEGKSALCHAAKKKRAGVVRALLAASDPSQKTPQGVTALMLAAEENSAECVELLLPVSNAKETAEEGKTALHLAAYHRAAAAVRALLPASDPLAKDCWGATALMLAAAMGSPECVELLLPSSRVNERSRLGDTALAHALSLCSSAKTLELLLPLSDLDGCGPDGQTAENRIGQRAPAEAREAALTLIKKERARREGITLRGCLDEASREPDDAPSVAANKPAPRL